MRITFIKIHSKCAKMCLVELDVLLKAWPTWELPSDSISWLHPKASCGLPGTMCERAFCMHSARIRSLFYVLCAFPCICAHFKCISFRIEPVHSDASGTKWGECTRRMPPPRVDEWSRGVHSIGRCIRCAFFTHSTGCEHPHAETRVKCA